MRTSTHCVVAVIIVAMSSVGSPPPSPPSMLTFHEKVTRLMDAFDVATEGRPERVHWGVVGCAALYEFSLQQFAEDSLTWVPEAIDVLLLAGAESSDSIVFAAASAGRLEMQLAGGQWIARADWLGDTKVRITCTPEYSTLEQAEAACLANYSRGLALPFPWMCSPVSSYVYKPAPRAPAVVANGLGVTTKEALMRGCLRRVLAERKLESMKRKAEPKAVADPDGDIDIGEVGDAEDALASQHERHMKDAVLSTLDKVNWAVHGTPSYWKKIADAIENMRLDVPSKMPSVPARYTSNMLQAYTAYKRAMSYAAQATLAKLFFCLPGEGFSLAVAEAIMNAEFP